MSKVRGYTLQELKIQVGKQEIGDDSKIYIENSGLGCSVTMKELKEFVLKGSITLGQDEDQSPGIVINNGSTRPSIKFNKVIGKWVVSVDGENWHEFLLKGDSTIIKELQLPIPSSIPSEEIYNVCLFVYEDRACRNIVKKIDSGDVEDKILFTINDQRFLPITCEGLVKKNENKMISVLVSDLKQDSVYYCKFFWYDKNRVMVGKEQFFTTNNYMAARQQVENALILE